ncbi:hypothetical protein M9H77_28203 [Catharanthus roseus]|uniref:Uncharacterized protein n=1 Tax=Catharanthus roseus TaxID=4058 RepID=A0ACC0AEV6_CATRO|nr:hypothetical protein M9H77_28203 [Catharanthus roseus]
MHGQKGELRSSQEEHNAPVSILPRTLKYLKEGAKPFLHSGKGSDSMIETGQSTTLCRFLACRPHPETTIHIRGTYSARCDFFSFLPGIGVCPLRIFFRYGMLPNRRVTIALELRW